MPDPTLTNQPPLMVPPRRDMEAERRLEQGRANERERIAADPDRFLAAAKNAVIRYTSNASIDEAGRPVPATQRNIPLGDYVREIAVPRNTPEVIQPRVNGPGSYIPADSSEVIAAKKAALAFIAKAEELEKKSGKGEASDQEKRDFVALGKKVMEQTPGVQGAIVESYDRLDAARQQARVASPSQNVPEDGAATREAPPPQIPRGRPR
jgi:hypothetical protein